MRKIILQVAVSLDGFIEGPNGELDWLVRDKKIDFGDILHEILSDKDIIFYGRVSYEQWGNFQAENASPKIKDAYKLLHSKQKYVFSRTKSSDNTKAIFINSDIQEKVLGLTNLLPGTIPLVDNVVGGVVNLTDEITDEIKAVSFLIENKNIQ